MSVDTGDYHQEIQTKSRFYTEDSSLIRMSKTTPTKIRTNSIIDVERIINIPFYNRYTGKTQVFSLYKNDDLTRRGLHVQLVSRTARTIGKALGLNTDLIEAIALGHDLGHTPFGHMGEKILDDILYRNTGRHFMHNVQSVRVLRNICPVGISLQTLDGILCHNGEFASQGLYPKDSKIHSFKDLDDVMEESYTEGADFVKHLVPSTLEGAVVRFSDMIAYLGKDRQDARKFALEQNIQYKNTNGISNSTIIKELTEDIVENSLGKNCIRLSDSMFKELQTLKNDNKEMYETPKEVERLGRWSDGVVHTLFNKMYDQFLKDIESGNRNSPIASHLEYLKRYQSDAKSYLDNYFHPISDKNVQNNQLVVDFIASMTDDYFYELSKLMYPDILKENNLEYVGYFNDTIKDERDPNNNKKRIDVYIKGLHG